MNLYEGLDENEKKILKQKIEAYSEKEILYIIDQKLENILDKLFEIEKIN